MLVHRRFPGVTPAPEFESSGRPVRTVIGDALKRFWRATRPPARVGAGAAGIALQRVVRTALAANMYLAAGAGVGTLWTLGKAWDIVPFAVLALLMVVAKTVWRVVLLPLQHISLAIVTVAVALEGLLAGRVFVQLAYEDNVEGLARNVLTLTEPIVAPFRELEGTALLHDTGVVEFATLAAMEAVLVATIAAVLLLMFWSEFLHMYRRVAEFFSERSERRAQRNAEREPELDATPAMAMAETQPAAAADLSAAS
jgi:hypothetical protein